MVAGLAGVWLAFVNTVNYLGLMTQTAEPQYEVRGKDRLFDQWTTFVGSYGECQLWADRRAFLVRGPEMDALITPVPA